MALLRKLLTCYFNSNKLFKLGPSVETMRSPSVRHAIAMRSPCDRHPITIRSPSDRHPIAIRGCSFSPFMNFAGPPKGIRPHKAWYSFTLRPTVDAHHGVDPGDHSCTISGSNSFVWDGLTEIGAQIRFRQALHLVSH